MFHYFTLVYFTMTILLNMRKKISFFESDGKIYNPDSCSPLADAWRKNEVELHTLARGTYPGYPLENDELSGIKCIGYWNAKKMQDWGLNWHMNEGIEICFLESGELDFDLNDRSYQLVPNTLTITRPWIPHKLGNPMITLSKLHWFILDVNVRQPHQEWQWPDWIILKKDDLNRLTDILRRNEQPVWTVGQEIKDCIVQIGRLIKKHDPDFLESKIKILINELLIELLEILTREKPELNNSLIMSKRSVDIFLKNLDGMLSEPWSLQGMADYCSLGTTQFSKYCAELTNTTPLNYLTQLRIRHAHHLIITEPCKTITEIAYECGFSSNQYFTQVFKKYYKSSPQEYRYSNLPEKALTIL